MGTLFCLMFAARQSSAAIGPALGRPAWESDFKLLIFFTSCLTRFSIFFIVFSPHLSSGFQSFDVFSPRVSSGQQLWCSPSHSDQILASTLWSFWRDKHKSNCWRRTERMFSPGIIGEKAFIIERCNGNGGQALCAEWRKSKWVNVENSFLFSSTLHCGWYEVQINFWKCSHTWRRRWSVCLQCMRSSCSPTDQPPWQNDDCDDDADDVVLLHLLLPHVHTQLGTLLSAGAAEDTVTIVNDDVSLTQSFPGRCLWRSRNQEQHCLGRQLWSLQGPSLGFKDMFGEDWFVTGCSLTHLIKFLSQRPPWYTWAIT